MQLGCWNQIRGYTTSRGVGDGDRSMGCDGDDRSPPFPSNHCIRCYLAYMQQSVQNCDTNMHQTYRNLSRLICKIFSRPWGGEGNPLPTLLAFGACRASNLALSELYLFATAPPVQHLWIRYCSGS